MNIILDDLREKDRFNILLFDGQVQQWQQVLQEASGDNVDRAHAYVNKIAPRGCESVGCDRGAGGGESFKKMPQ